MRGTTGWREGRAVVAAGLMTLALGGPGPGAWTTADTSEAAEGDSLHAVDAALSRGDLGAAERVAQQAYASARASRSWESMMAAGDAYRHIAEGASTHSHAIGKARDA